MFESEKTEGNGESQGHSLTRLQVLEQLENEVQSLNDERADLMDIEEKLVFMLNELIEAKRIKNEELRLEIEKQKTRCEELARSLDESTRENYSMSVG